MTTKYKMKIDGDSTRESAMTLSTTVVADEEKYWETAAGCTHESEEEEVKLQGTP